MSEPGASGTATQGKVLLYECFAGIAGDMHLGALIDVGVPIDLLRAELGKLGLDDAYELVVSRQTKLGIGGTHVRVNLREQDADHRSFTTIKAMIERSSLSPDVKRRATRMFRKLAEAEAKIHDISVDNVHFHEVGAVDAIIDLTGAAIGLSYLQPAEVVCTNVELGSGLVNCEHGMFPVPAPATAELLRGAITTRGKVEGEATTPTGAAILASVVTRWEPRFSFRSEAIGYGVGTKEFEIPNVLRVSLGSTHETAWKEDALIEISCNVDDMSPEAFEPLIEELVALGVRDVFLTPILMKKSRPATKISVLVDDALQDETTSLLLNQSTSLGVRFQRVTRAILPREEREVATRLGPVTVKIATRPDGSVRWKSEYDDVRQLAAQHALPYLKAKHVVDEDIAKELE